MWVHEIKHDGYHLMVRRTTQGVRIKTRRGYDWTDRFPVIVEAASELRASSFVIDGEGVILRPDGLSDFDRLHSRRHDGEAQLLGFDLLELDGLDVRTWPLARRKAALARLLQACSNTVAPFIASMCSTSWMPSVDPCKLGLEGIVSKRRDKPYRHGRCREWLKVKNPASPAMTRVWEDQQ